MPTLRIVPRVTILLLTLGAVMAAAQPALAAGVSAHDPSRWVRVRANDGEQNRVTVSVADDQVTVTDELAPLVAEENCVQVTEHEVRCTIIKGDARVDALLGDGDDEATALGALHVKFEGEAGNDVLTGGSADDNLSGGDGNDRLTGGEGVDEHDAGEGDDTIAARDGVREPVLCAGGADTGEADLEDDVAADCESVVKPLPPPGLETVQPEAQAPQPAPGQSVAAVVKSGVVLARVPGVAGYAPLDPAKPIPVGTVIDARNGTLALTAAADRAGATQTADFTGGRFVVGQTGTKMLTTELRLSGGDFRHCSSATARRATAHAAARRTVRRLWGSGKGRFRTRGRTSAATVRGTVWIVEDRCDGTLTRVKEGVVVVENLRTGRTKVIRAGESWLVRRRPARR